MIPQPSHGPGVGRPTGSPAAGVPLAQAIDEARLGTLQLGVVALCLLVSTLDGLDIQALSFAAPAIVKDLHVTPGQLGVVFSATLLGSIAGSYLGVLADRFGRRALITASVLIFAVFTFACGLSRGTGDLLAFRCLAGVGLGGAVPSMIALASEFAPRRWRSGAVTLVLCGFPIGAIVGGLAASPLIAGYGWRAIFFAGATASGLLVPALLWFCPESVRYLALKRPDGPAVRKLLDRLRPDLAGATPILLPPPTPAAARRASATVFRREHLPGLVLLSLAGFSSLLLQYLMSSWTPLLLQRAGLSLKASILGGVLFSAGALVGSAAISFAVSGRNRGVYTLAAAFLLGGVAVLGASAARGRPGLELAALAAFGFFQFGAQIGSTNYSQFYFPTAVRASGLAWVQGVSRLGALTGPLVGGRLLTLGLRPDHIFSYGAAPAAITATCLLVLARLTRDRTAPSAALPSPLQAGSPG